MYDCQKVVSYKNTQNFIANSFLFLEFLSDWSNSHRASLLLETLKLGRSAQSYKVANNLCLKSKFKKMRRATSLYHYRVEILRI